MEGLAAVCDDRRLQRKVYPSLRDQYRQLMERLGRQLSDLYTLSDGRRHAGALQDRHERHPFE